MSNSITPSFSTRRSRRSSLSSTAASSSSSSSSASRRGRRQLQLPTRSSSAARRISLESESESESENETENPDLNIDEGFTVAQARAEMNERGVGGESDDEHETFVNEIEQSTIEASRFRVQNLNFDESAVLDHGNELDLEADSNSDEESDQDIDEDGFELRRMQRIFGPSIPTDWSPPAPKVSRGEPRNFSDVDNSGEWDEFCFHPKFLTKGNKKYIHHSLPTGVVPVPKDNRNGGERMDGGWEFHYRGWESENTFRDGATKDNLFPDERIGSLDGDLLKKMGLTKERMKEGDALFFHQLLLPMCRPEKSGINGDPRKGFYEDVENFSNAYAICELKMGTAYGHKFKPITIPELVHFDGVVVRDGVNGGSSGALYRRWIPDGSASDEYIMNAITYTRFLEIKKCMKLNNNMLAKKKGEDGYDPAYKYDLIWNVLFYNINAVTKEADLDLCGDETTWGHSGYAEAGTGITGRIKNKPCVSKGGQTVIVSDVSRNRPRAYLHRHKLLDHPKGVTAKGQAEVIHLANKIEKMVKIGEGDEGNGSEKKIFKKKPCFTFDNFFSGEYSLNYLGNNGFGGVFTCARNRLPKGVKKESFHHQKTDASIKTKVARFYEPVVAVKSFKSSNNNPDYKRAHISFQSTSSCNISTVNALSSCLFFTREKERGVGQNKKNGT